MNMNTPTPRHEEERTVCAYCGNDHGALKCPLVSALEFAPDGSGLVSRIEFFPSLPQIEGPAPVLHFGTESDEDLRVRLHAAAGSGTIYDAQIDTYGGPALDTIAAFYGLKRQRK